MSYGTGNYASGEYGGSVAPSGGSSFSDTASLAGAGALTVTTTPAEAAAATLAGSGSLTVPTKTPGLAVAAALAGTGALTSVEGLADTANLAGSGALTASITPRMSESPALAGVGVLSAVRLPALAVAAALAGSGSLSVVVVPSFSVIVGLGGSGSLSVPALASVGLSGTGVLSLTRTATMSGIVNFLSSPASVTEVVDDSMATTGGGGGVIGELQVVVLDDTVRRAPSSITVMVSGGRPEESITFQMDAGLTPSGQADVYTTTLDSEGSLSATSLTIIDDLGGQQGVRTLTAVQGSITATDFYTVLLPPTVWPTTQGPDADPVAIPGALDAAGVRHWVLQDLLGVMDGGIGSYVLPVNPRSMTSPHLEHALKTHHTTAKSGKYHIFQAGNFPKEWTFTGYAPTQEMVEQLFIYRDLNRRFYVIDHRNRAWKVVFTNVDAVPRLRHNYNGEITDWGSDFTVTATILDQSWSTPV